MTDQITVEQIIQWAERRRAEVLAEWKNCDGVAGTAVKCFGMNYILLELLRDVLKIPKPPKPGSYDAGYQQALKDHGIAKGRS